MTTVTDIYGDSHGWEELPGALCDACKGTIHVDQPMYYVKDDQENTGIFMHQDRHDCIRHLRRENERLAVTVRQLERALIRHGALPKTDRIATAKKGT